MALIGIYFIINLIGRQTILYDVPSRSRYLMNQCYFNSRKKLRICISITRKVKVKVEEKVSAWCFLYSHFSQRRLRYWPLHYLWSPWFLSNKKINSAFSVGRKKLKVPSQQSTEMIKSFDKLDWCETATWNPDESASQEWNKVKRLLTEIAAEAFGYQKSSKPDWFQDNINLQPFLDTKHQAAVHHRMNPGNKPEQELLKTRSSAQHSLFCECLLTRTIQKHTENFATIY